MSDYWDNDVVCPDCGKNLGRSAGAVGMLTMHRKWKHNGGKKEVKP